MMIFRYITMDQSDSVAVYFFGFLQTNNEKLEEEKK
jgi:hypothetical protein